MLVLQCNTTLCHLFVIATNFWQLLFSQIGVQHFIFKRQGCLATRRICNITICGFHICFFGDSRGSMWQLTAFVRKDKFYIYFQY